VISESLRFEGFDSRSWTNLIGLFAPNVVHRLESEGADSDAPVADESSSAARSGSLIVVLDDREHVLMAMHTRNGRIKGLEYEGPDSLEAMAERWSASRCVVLREGVMEEIAERAAYKTERGDDYLAQLLVISRTIREMSEAGLLLTWPRTFEAAPIPTIGMVNRALDTVLPDNHAVVIVIWNGNSVWSALVLRRRDGFIDLVAGPDLLTRWTGPLGGDWRRDYRVISEAVDRAAAPVHLGIFTNLGTLRELLRSYDPGAWATAVAVRDVIVSPTPPYIAVALGADVVRATAKESARWLGGIDALGQFAPLANFVRSRIAEVASVTATLGFDPLNLLAQWLRRAEPVSEGGPSVDSAADQTVDADDDAEETPVDDA